MGGSDAQRPFYTAGSHQTAIRVISINTMKANHDAAIKRLQTLYSKRGEDRIFAHISVRLPQDRAERITEAAAEIPLSPFPPVESFLPLWTDYLSFYDDLEDDWVPAMYLRPYDQGLFGALFGADIVLDRVDGPGWICSMTGPITGKEYADLASIAAQPQEEWLERLETEMHTCAGYASYRFGVSVPITVDALNLAMQLRGNQVFLDLYDQPDELKTLLQAGVDLNICVVERARNAIGPQLSGGVCDFFHGGWLPNRGIPMSVDCYNICDPSVYTEFGLPYQQQLINHFGSANFHIHGNGRQLLPEVAKLDGMIVVSIGNDGSDVAAFDEVEKLKRIAGSLVLAIPCNVHEFSKGIGRGNLPGGVFYAVSGVEDIGTANRLMEQVRQYRV